MVHVNISIPGTFRIRRKRMLRWIEKGRGSMNKEHFPLSGCASNYSVIKRLKCNEK